LKEKLKGEKVINREPKIFELQTKWAPPYVLEAIILKED
jgi:hypothetical protein